MKKYDLNNLPARWASQRSPQPFPLFKGRLLEDFTEETEEVDCGLYEMDEDGVFGYPDDPEVVQVKPLLPIPTGVEIAALTEVLLWNTKKDTFYMIQAECQIEEDDDEEDA